jgi:hypothetical protein
MRVFDETGRVVDIDTAEQMAWAEYEPRRAAAVGTFRGTMRMLREASGDPEPDRDHVARLYRRARRAWCMLPREAQRTVHYMFCVERAL